MSILKHVKLDERFLIWTLRSTILFMKRELSFHVLGLGSHRPVVGSLPRQPRGSGLRYQRSASTKHTRQSARTSRSRPPVRRRPSALAPRHDAALRSPHGERTGRPNIQTYPDATPPCPSTPFLSRTAPPYALGGPYNSKIALNT